MRVAHGCGRRRRELRFPEGLALSLSGSGWLAPVLGYSEGMSWDWGCPVLLHFIPFIFFVNEPVLRRVCSHVHHELINYLISLFLSKR